MGNPTEVSGQTGLHDPTGRVYRMTPDGEVQVRVTGVGQEFLQEHRSPTG